MVSYKLKIGLAPCRRNFPKFPGRKPGGIWSPEAAQDMKQKTVPYILENFTNEHVEFVDLEWLNDEGFMYDYDQAQEIADHFKAEKIDALFIANINFGCEEVAGKVAQLIGLPTLIWSPQEEEFGISDVHDIYDPKYGGRLLDAQCGLFAISKILQRYHVKFTEIPTCKVESDTFKQYFEDFTAVALMLKNWRNMRIMQLGNRPVAFTSMMFNDDDLLEKFGIEVFPYTSVEAAQHVLKIEEERADEIQPIVDDFLSYFPAGDKDLRDNPQLRRGAAILLMYRELFEQKGISAICCDNNFTRAIGGGSLTDIMMACNENKFVSYEHDMFAAITMVLLSSATFGEKLPFFGEFTANHPTNPNAELIWHVSVFPPKVAGHDSFEPYIMKSNWGVQTGFEVARGDYTIARLDTMNGKYSMLLGNFKGVEGPFTRQHYIWGEFKDWQKFEQATMYGPYVHHMVEIEGGEAVLRRMKEFCRYAGIYADVPDERTSPFADFYYGL